MDQTLVFTLIVLWIVVLFNLLLTITIIQRLNKLPKMSPTGPLAMLQIGDSAPEFSIETLDGHVVTQADYAGRQRIMVFISPHCAACRAHMAELQSLHPRVLKSGVELMVISLADARETRMFAEEHKFKAPIYVAPADINPLSQDYLVVGTPQFYLIDEKQSIQAADSLGYEWEQLTKQWKTD